MMYEYRVVSRTTTTTKKKKTATCQGLEGWGASAHSSQGVRYVFAHISKPYSPEQTRKTRDSRQKGGSSL